MTHLPSVNRRLALAVLGLAALTALACGRPGMRGGGARAASPSGFTRYSIDAASHPSARCNDGTTPVFYLQRSATPEKRWVLWLKGGMSCSDAEGCAERDRTLTSSTPWGPSIDNRLAEGKPGGILSDDPAQNPDFHEWNHAYLVYCTSDDWAGTARASENKLALHFTGRYVLDAMLDAMRDESIVGANTLADASEVLLTGSSAGAKGVFLNADRVAASLPKARVRAIADAGLLSRDATGERERDELTARRALWGARSDDDCEASQPSEPWRCLDAGALIASKSIRTDLFWRQDQLDPKIVGDRNSTTPAERDAQMARVRNLIEQVPYGFASRLHEHTLLNTAKFTESLDHGQSLATLVGNWYFDRPGPKKQISAD